MSNVVNALKRVYTHKLYIFITAVLSAIVLGLYYAAITAQVPFNTFMSSSTTVFTILQLIFSFINAVLIGVALTMFMYVFRQRQKTNSATITQALTSLFFSVATSGCYVCGTVLLPSVGVAASFTSLPFGGLEIKFLTILLLVYSIHQYAQVILEICKIQKFKTVKIELGSKEVIFSTKHFYNAKPIIISASFIVLIFTLPIITNTLGFKGYIGANSEFKCERH